MRQLLRRLWYAIRQRRFKVDLAEEMEFHRAMTQQDLEDRGVDRTDAAFAARRAFGSAALAQDLARDVWISRWLDDLTRDIRLAFRALRKTPVFAGVAILSLAFSIGANSTLFSVINAVLLRPLPFDDPDTLYVISGTHQGVRREFTSFSDFADWRAQSRAFAHMAAIRREGASMTTPAGPEYVTGAAVSEDFFALFRVQPSLGRTFLAADHQAGHGQIVVLSHGVWLRHFGGDPAVIGKSVVLNGALTTVVGVMAAGFAFPDHAALWRPLTLMASVSNVNRRVDILQVVARLRTDVPLDQAQAEMTRIARQLEQTYPTTNANWGAQLVPLQAKSTEAVRPTLLALWAAVACVLLVGCANVGILVLARGARRGRELAVRTALGAGRSRIVRQLLAESVLIALLGGIGSLLVAAWGVVALRALAPAGTRFDGVGLDVSVLIFTAAVSVGSGLLIGLVPLRRVVRSESQRMLTEGAPSASGGVRQRHVMRVLAIAEVTVSLVLLIGAGLMIRTLQRLQAVNLGFNPDRLLTFYVSLPQASYPKTAQVGLFFDDLLERVRALPGVRSASAMNALYVYAGGRSIVVPVRLDGRPAPDRSIPPDTHVRIVDAGIHRLLEIPVLRGRSFTVQDGPDAAVINEMLARRYFANENPIGRRISVRFSAPDKPVWQEIVGVVGDVRHEGPDADVLPEIHIPFTQSPIRQMAILVRAVGDPAALAPSIRDRLRALDPNLPMTSMQTMEHVIGTSVAKRRFAMRLLTAFAGSALLLTAIGIFGVMAATVSARRRDIAIRLALGGSPRRVVWTVVRQMVVIAVTGLTAGIIVALSATRYLEGLLFGIPRTDPMTYATTAVIIVVVTLLSSYLPARRAVKVDPLVALRCE